ncbi:catalase family peroxidase [Tahibacter soli]|uniref:Catalase-related peroxidase n=1 Tax=Tahibacter soli TaxID=2983605 RepID=A0A9X4BH88_9GAMM|nr:catalase family peroxidase [Tahibacter soli]MDC8012073.1 catalase family peroxidase [Tahibacter soli]
MHEPDPPSLPTDPDVPAAPPPVDASPAAVPDESAPPGSPNPAPALLGIGAIVLAAAGALAWTAGWIGGGLTAQRMTDAIEAIGAPHPGFRRAHAKGVCVYGTFRANGAAVALSSARVFAQKETPVLGRFSIAGGDPHGADAKARVRSLALLLRTDDGQEWRTAMNSFPFFPVATPEGFHAQSLASAPDPKTGKPDPAKLAAFVAQYPEVKKFQAWAASAPWSNSWGNTEYNGVNAFVFTAADGSARYVRWSMRPQLPFAPLESAQRDQADADFLADDLNARLIAAPLAWDMVLTIAAPGDAVNDASQAWPDDRERVVAGTLELTRAEPQASGRCRDVNYDPLILPTGIAGSDDPILAARSAVYSQSFNRREREIAHGRAPEATGRGGAQ